jgi:Heparinase II/III-like protein/Heparinase II/III N-terminus
MTRPRPVACLTDHEHRDRGVAEAVAAGRFTFHGETRVLGTEPDWLHAALPADEEWRIEWVKFAYGLDLAAAHADTGDPRFREAWERLVRSWIRTSPPGHDRSEVTARRILNWVYAWQALPDLDHGLERALLESIGAQARHVRRHLAPERNHRTLELYALLICALALPELDRGGELRGFALAELDRNLATDFRADGVHREASTHYHMIALRSFVGARENARRFGLRLPAGFDERLSRACDFALHCRRPDGLIPALSDGDTGDYSELLALAGDLLGRDDLRWAGTRGRVGRAPSRRLASFPDGGYFVQRSGWSRHDRFLIFDCGPLGDGGHGHYDLLAFEACAGGRPLLVDPGRFTYDEGSPNLRRRFRGTAAHNTVCVDGRDQTPYTRGRPDGRVAHGRFLGRASAPGLDVLAGEATSHVYEAVHRRRIAFVDERYWIVEDRLRGEHAHRYELRFQLAPEARGRAWIAGDGVVVAPGLALVVLGAAALTLERGWVAPSYGHRLDAPMAVAAVHARSARFVTLVAPLEPGAPVPRLTRDGRELHVDGLSPRRETVVLGDEALDVHRGREIGVPVVRR